jgi:hypothetical protein
MKPREEFVISTDEKPASVSDWLGSLDRSRADLLSALFFETFGAPDPETFLSDQTSAGSNPVSLSGE